MTTCERCFIVARRWALGGVSDIRAWPSTLTRTTT